MRTERQPLPDPVAVAAEIREQLSRLADPRRASSSQRFFKSPVPLYGIPAPELRRVARDRIRTLRSGWSSGQIVALADELIQVPELEVKAVGLLVLAGWLDELPVSLLPRLKSWLSWHCGNWATVDLLAVEILGPLLDAHPELIPEVEDWPAAPSVWVRRAAAVAFVKHARQGRHLAVAYRIARQLLPDEEDLLHKSVGWLLRECGRTDRARLERFLLQHGPLMSRTTVRYALEHFPEARRHRLLEATRS
jgi:3-methyladenine DNA glycosylase AlkD